jgi:trimeric autotransporter adhesin
MGCYPKYIGGYIRIMGKIEIDHTGSGGGITLSSDGTDLLLDGVVVGGGGGSSALTISDKTAVYTVVADDLGKIINCTSGTFTVSLTSAATLGAGFSVTIWNTSTTATHAITIDPSGAETIDGRTTLILRRGEGVQVVCNGSNWQTNAKKAMRGYAENISTDAGDAPVASGDGSLALSYASVASGSASVAIGTDAIASGLRSLALGRSAFASSSYASAIGANSSVQGSQAVTGAGAMALGGSYASGVDSFAAAMATNSSAYGATGANSIAMGSLAKATGNSSVAIGTSNTASGVGSICIGSTGASIASGTNSVAIGNQATASGSGSVVISSNGTGWGSDATAGSSFALGDGAVSSIKGKFAFSSGSATVSKGLMQAGMIVLTQVTSSISPNTLNSYNYSASGTTNQVILPNNSAFAFHGVIVARQQASLGTGCAAWKIEGLIRREGSAGTTVLVNSATTILDNTPAWGMALSADTTNGGLAITVTGAATNIRWVATINTSEVTY